MGNKPACDKKKKRIGEAEKTINITSNGKNGRAGREGKSSAPPLH